MNPSVFKRPAVIAIPALTAIGFIEDIFTSRGVDDWAWYFVALILTIFLNRRPLPFLLASLYTILTMLGYYISPKGAADRYALINCLLGIGVLWATATIIFCRYKTESEWRQSEQRYHSLFENMQAGFAYCQMIFQDGRPDDFIYLSVNPAFEKITGLKNVTGRRVTEVWPGIKTIHPELFEFYGKVAASGVPVKFEYFLKPAKLWLSVSAYCPAKGYFVTTFENITERKRAEESALLFRALIDRSSDGIDVVDPATGQFCDVNEVSCRQLGYTREEMLTMRVSDIDSKIKQSGWADLAADLRQKKSAVIEGCQRRKDGTTFPVEVNIRWVELEREYIVATVRDITERKRSEETLRQSEDRLRMVTENARVGLVMINRERRYTFANGAYSKILGLAEGDIVGERLADVLSSVYETQIRPRLDRAFAGERVSYELQMPAHGEEHFFSVKYEPMVESGAVSRVVVVITDITEPKRANEEAQKQLDELQRWHGVMIGREERIQGLKQEVNELLVKQQQTARYEETTVS